MSSVINDIEESLAELAPTLNSLSNLCGTPLTRDNAADVISFAREELAKVREALADLASIRDIYPTHIPLRTALQRINRRIAKYGLRVATSRSTRHKEDFGQFLLLEGNIIRDAFANADRVADYARTVGALGASETIATDTAYDLPICTDHDPKSVHIDRSDAGL